MYQMMLTLMFAATMGVLSFAASMTGPGPSASGETLIIAEGY